MTSTRKKIGVSFPIILGYLFFCHLVFSTLVFVTSFEGQVVRMYVCCSLDADMCICHVQELGQTSLKLTTVRNLINLPFVT